MMPVLKLLLVLIQFTNFLQYISKFANRKQIKALLYCNKIMTLHIKNITKIKKINLHVFNIISINFHSISISKRF